MFYFSFLSVLSIISVLPLVPEKAATKHFPSYLIVFLLNMFRGLLAEGSLTRI